MNKFYDVISGKAFSICTRQYGIKHSIYISMNIAVLDYRQ